MKQNVSSITRRCAPWAPALVRITLRVVVRGNLLILVALLSVAAGAHHHLFYVIGVEVTGLGNTNYAVYFA